MAHYTPAEGVALRNRRAEPMRAMLQAAREHLYDACNALAEADDATQLAFDLEHGMRARHLAD